MKSGDLPKRQIPQYSASRQFLYPPAWSTGIPTPLACLVIHISLHPISLHLQDQSEIFSQILETFFIIYPVMKRMERFLSYTIVHLFCIVKFLWKSERKNANFEEKWSCHWLKDFIFSQINQNKREKNEEKKCKKYLMLNYDLLIL